MAAQKFRVIFTQSAWNDLEEIVAYWTECDEPERGDARAATAFGCLWQR